GDPFYNYHALTGLAGELRPTHVVFALNGTDLSDYTMRGGFSRFRDGEVRYRPAPWFHLLFRFSHVVRYFVIERAGLDYNFQPMARYDELRAEAADSIAVCLQRAAAFCEVRNIRFLAVTHAMPSILCAMDSLTTMEVDEFRRALDGLPVVHLSPCLASRI